MRKKEKKGITLIELLVGVSIFSVIASSLYMTFANGVLFSRKAQARDGIIQDAQWTVNALSEDLENMVPYTQGNVLGEVFATRVEQATDGNVDLTLRDVQGPAVGANSFAGEPDGLTLVTATDKGLRQVRYYLALPEDVHIHQALVRYLKAGSSVESGVIGQDQPKHVLLVREERPFPFINVADVLEKTEREVLSFHVLEESLSFSYAYWNDQDVLSWIDQWGKQGVPVGVRVRAAFVSSSEKIKPLEIEQDILVPLGMRRLLKG